MDVFYLDPESDLRFAPIPDEMVGVLEGVLRQAKTFDARADVTFLGLSEGVLYWREGRGLDKPLAAATPNYHIVQIDVPVFF